MGEGGVGGGLEFRRGPSRVEFCVPVTSPANEPEKLVAAGALRLVKPAPLPVMTPLVTVRGTLTISALPFAVNELDTSKEYKPVIQSPAPLVPLPPLPKAARA